MDARLALSPLIHKSRMQPLLISHYTLTSSLGKGTAEHLRALTQDRSGLAPCRFETASLDTWTGQVPDAELPALEQPLTRFDCRNNRLALTASRQDDFEQAVAQARARYGPQRIGLFMGTSTSGILQTELAYRRRDAQGALPHDFDYAGTHNNFSLAAVMRAHLALAGPAFTVSTACSSSAKVFANAARMIASGVCDAAVVGGTDSLCLTTLYGFGALELLSREPCRPFDSERSGISIGEGAGFALLEPVGRAIPDDAIVLLGTGESSDAYHMSTPHPEGAGARAAMAGALKSAGIDVGDIDYINLHGTATRTNDAAEANAVYELFGASTACSSTKGATGHLLGASGIVEGLICVTALREGFMPGSPNTRQLDPAMRVQYLLRHSAQAPRRAMSNSFGFGGSNCSLIFARADVCGF
jgi:3-oxoacyl-[acyl-carrier-protein] synthase-1